MALYILQPGVQPLGQFDCLDGYVAGLMGGEVGTLHAASRTNTTTEKAAYDARAGLDNSTDLKRAAVAPWITSLNQRPLWLLDEGTKGYGTLFGQVIGTPVGLSTVGPNLGPHTAAGSGKVTCWDKPGLYAVSVDAVNTASDGIVVTNVACVPGALLDTLGNGKLSLASSSSAVGVKLGTFVEFETHPFLVTTPPSLVGAAEAAVRAIIYYNVY